MASFPTLEPATRAYDFGAIPLTNEASLAAGTVRFRHATVASDYQLTLGYQYLTDAEATLIREHFAEQGGGNISFLLPAIVWKGHGYSGGITSALMRWRYASPPEEEHFSAGYVNLQVSLVSDGVIDRSPTTVYATITPGAASNIEIPYLIGTFINSDATADTSHVLTVPTHASGDLLVAVLMWRLPESSITAPAGWTLHTGDLLSSIVFSGAEQNLHVYTKTATSSEPASYTWSAASSVRNAGLMVSVRNGAIDAITENYGNAATATIATSADRLNLTVFTWIYASVSSETYSQSASAGTLTQVTDSPTAQARLSGGYISSAATVTSTHSTTNTADNPNHGGICIAFEWVAP